VNASFTNHCGEGLEHVVHIEEIPFSTVGQYGCNQMLSLIRISLHVTWIKIGISISGPYRLAVVLHNFWHMTFFFLMKKFWHMTCIRYKILSPFFFFFLWHIQMVWHSIKKCFKFQFRGVKLGKKMRYFKWARRQEYCFRN
jgi:hypothetical protein